MFKGMWLTPTTLTLVENTSLHVCPSREAETAKDCAGNSQEIFIRSRLRVSPRSMVRLTAPASPGLLAQKVASSPSTAAAAECDAAFADDVAATAACMATFSIPAPPPVWLKHFDPPTCTCPFGSIFHGLALPQSDIARLLPAPDGPAHCLLAAFINWSPLNKDQSSRPSAAATALEQASKRTLPAISD